MRQWFSGTRVAMKEPSGDRVMRNTKDGIYLEEHDRKWRTVGKASGEVCPT